MRGLWRDRFRKGDRFFIVKFKDQISQW